MDKDQQVESLERYIRELKQQLAEVINERDSLKAKNLQITKERSTIYPFWQESTISDNITSKNEYDMAQYIAKHTSTTGRIALDLNNGQHDYNDGSSSY